ncbi:MAG: ribonuclease P protein component [Candidatus Kapabacteria bacterium]|nr:ribonuclease P protein component [Candidatus Kapabacteria bacterium]
MNYIFEHITLRSLKSDQEFDDVFRASMRIPYGSIVARVRLRPRTVKPAVQGVQVIGFAVQVPKKKVRLAVLRNRIKRLVRESLRLLCKENPQMFGNIESVIVQWNATTDAVTAKGFALTDIMPQLQSVLELAHAKQRQFPAHRRRRPDAV